MLKKLTGKKTHQANQIKNKEIKKSFFTCNEEPEYRLCPFMNMSAKTVKNILKC